MIKSYYIFENFSELIDNFVNINKTDRVFKKPTNYKNLFEAYKEWTSEDKLNMIIYESIYNVGIFNSNIGLEILKNNSNILTDFIYDNPHLVTNKFKNENDITNKKKYSKIY